MVITPEGDVYPCCTMGKPPVILGNVHNENLYDMWKGKKLQNLRLEMLNNGYSGISSCKKCGVPTYQTAYEDYLDDYTDMLKSKYISEADNE